MGLLLIDTGFVFLLDFHDLIDFPVPTPNPRFHFEHLVADVRGYEIDVQLGLAEQTDQTKLLLFGIFCIFVDARERKLLVDAIATAEACTKLALL